MAEDRASHFKAELPPQERRRIMSELVRPPGVLGVPATTLLWVEPLRDREGFGQRPVDRAAIALGGVVLAQAPNGFVRVRRTAPRRETLNPASRRD